MTKNFLDRFKKPSEKKSSSNNNNPLAGWFGNSNSNQSSFGGTGQSLGGSQPGKVIPIELSQPGPLGLKVERRPNSQGTAIVQQVIAGSQAQQAGLERGDVLCFAGSNGGEEIMYDMFLELAKSDQRPLCFEVRRVPRTKAASASSTSNASTGTTAKNNSAEAYARKQAVIAAAEKREKEHKKKSKPIPKTNKDSLPQILSTADKRRLEDERKQRIQDEQVKDLSAATKEAAAAAKSAEQKTVAALGYNPYETKSLSAGQARNAVTTTTHGGMTADTNNTTSTPQQQPQSSIPAVAAPPPLPAAEDATVPLDFQQAFETTVTSNPDHAAVVNTINILRKLIVNATTKGQQQAAAADVDSQDAAAKFRKIRLANPKIRAAVTEQPGAVDLLLCTGFELHHHDDSDESMLVYPPPASRSDTPPAWLPAALEQLEKYVQSQ